MRVWYMVCKASGESVGFTESRHAADEAADALNRLDPTGAPHVVAVAHEQLCFDFLKDAP